MRIVKFMGGVGNQLFQALFYLKLKEDFPGETVLGDFSHYQSHSDHGGYRLQPYLEIASCGDLDRDSFYTVTDETFLFSEYRNETGNIYYSGYWQSEKFFPKDRSLLETIFSENKLDEKDKTILQEIVSTNSVFIHVRRGDYIGDPLLGNIATRAYYNNAINYMYRTIDQTEKPIRFFVFSDDIKWASKNLVFEKKDDVRFIPGNDARAITDLILMKNCSHQIMANSSFSRWGYILNRNVGKITITPEYTANSDQCTEYREIKSIQISNTPFFNSHVKEPEFSIIMYLDGDFFDFRRCLTSVLDQTFSSFEVILIKDGSSKVSDNEIETFSQKDLRVRRIDSPYPLTKHQAIMECVPHTEGKYLLFIDCKDFLSDECLALLHSHVQKSNSDVICFDYRTESQNRAAPDELKTNDTSFGSENSVWDKRCYRTEIIKKHIRSIRSKEITEAFLQILISRDVLSYETIGDIHYYHEPEPELTNVSLKERIVLIQNETSLMEQLLRDCGKPEAFRNAFVSTEITPYIEQIEQSNDNSLKLLLYESMDHLLGTNKKDTFNDRINRLLCEYDNLFNKGHFHRVRSFCSLSKKIFKMTIRQDCQKIKNLLSGR